MLLNFSGECCKILPTVDFNRIQCPPPLKVQMEIDFRILGNKAETQMNFD